MIELQAVLAVIGFMLVFAAGLALSPGFLFAGLAVGLGLPIVGVAARKLEQPPGERLAKRERWIDALLATEIDCRWYEVLVFTCSYAGLMMLIVRSSTW